MAALGIAFASDRAAAEAPPDHYTIEATLDAEAHVVSGVETIRWTNRSSQALPELWFHLYLNAFESRETVFATEARGSMRGVRQTGFGHIDVTELHVGGKDLLSTAESEIVPGDHTQLRVPVDDPIMPGGEVSISIRFEAHLPPLFARAGYDEGFHMVAQWFPKLAVVTPEGQWVSFPYHARGEFYSDFADYDLEVIAPRNMVVGATGETMATRDLPEERRLHRFRARRVHDVAFVAWERFLERRMRVGQTEVRTLYPSGYETIVDKHETVVRDGLLHFAELFGDYPYPALTMVVPPRGADGAAGMEYPQLFVTAGFHSPLPGIDALDADVTAHELAHQWFQGLIATNEVAWPMLDEGLAQWATGELARARGASGPFGIGFFDVMRFGAVPEREVLPPAQPAYAFGSGDYGRLVYARTAVVLETIHRSWGRARFLRALQRYCREQRFQHPEPTDLFDAFDQEYWSGFSEAVLVPSLFNGAGASVEIASVHSRRHRDGYRTSIDGRRFGAVPIPVSVVLVDDQGGRQWITWPGREQRLIREVDTSHRIVRVVVDPEGRNLLDPDPEDNRWRPRRPQDGFFLTRLLATMQTLLASLGP